MPTENLGLTPAQARVLKAMGEGWRLINFEYSSPELMRDANTPRSRVARATVTSLSRWGFINIGRFDVTLTKHGKGIAAALVRGAAPAPKDPETRKDEG